MKQIFIVSVINLETGSRSLTAAYNTFKQARNIQIYWNDMFTIDKLQRIATIETLPLIDQED